MTEALGLVGFFPACPAAAGSGAFWGPGEWYERLRKPAWNPPNWLFPIAWAVLYAAIAVAAWLVCGAASGSRRRSGPGSGSCC
jgi:tryptophan-rich sensory protein